MDDLTTQTLNRSFPELIHSTLENLRNLRLEGPPALQAENYAKVWRSLSTAGNNLMETIEDLRLDGHERWETGDTASVELFGRLAVPQAKEFLQNVMSELASLGTTSHANSDHTIIDTRRFDLDRVPLLVKREATDGDVKMEDVETKDIKKEDVDPGGIKPESIKPEIISPKAIKTESISPPPQDPIFPSIERQSTPLCTLKTSTSLTQHTATTNSFKPPTAPRPSAYKTPPRGPSFSPITPPKQTITETNTNNNTNPNPNTTPPHPPLQYSSPRRFRSQVSTIDFDSFNYDDLESMFEFPAPTEVQKELSPPLPPAQLAAQPGSATSTALAEQEYMASAKRVVANFKALVYLMRPLSQGRSREG